MYGDFSLVTASIVMREPGAGHAHNGALFAQRTRSDVSVQMTCQWGFCLSSFAASWLIIREGNSRFIHFSSVRQFQNSSKTVFRVSVCELKMHHKNRNRVLLFLCLFVFLFCIMMMVMMKSFVTSTLRLLNAEDCERIMVKGGFGLWLNGGLLVWRVWIYDGVADFWCCASVWF